MTGSNDCMLRLWRLTRREGHTSFSQTYVLKAHSASVTCVSVCRVWSIAVSGSEDGTAVIWDLNRAMYVRTIYHQNPSDSNEEPNHVRQVAINESTVSGLLHILLSSC